MDHIPRLGVSFANRKRSKSDCDGWKEMKRSKTFVLYDYCLLKENKIVKNHCWDLEKLINTEMGTQNPILYFRRHNTAHRVDLAQMIITNSKTNHHQHRIKHFQNIFLDHLVSFLSTQRFFLFILLQRNTSPLCHSAVFFYGRFSSFVCVCIAL